MNSTTQEIIVFLIVALSIGWAIRRIFFAKKKGNGCCGSSDCDSCPHCQNRCKK
ncbi:MAG: FeoB-associated Cys-rich membrane protein [Paludibacteraceae bacterium]|nr:FeoB-associated Cys-rich membrane protein [Paludibacteraceae bacterium]